MAVNYLESILDKLWNIPGIRVSRVEYLCEEFAKKYKYEMIDILGKGPVSAGISQDEIGKIADQSIRAEAMTTILTSAGTGLFGGFAALAAVPADMVQFYIHVFRIMQKLLYLYGWNEEFYDDEGNIDDGGKNVLLLYLGVMSGVEEAGKAASEIMKAAAKRSMHDVPIQFFKTYVEKPAFHVIINTIVKTVGIKTSIKFGALVSSKIIPVVGAAVSAVITRVLYVPMAQRLKNYLANGVLEIDDEENLPDANGDSDENDAQAL